MNLYIRYFDSETLVTNVDDALYFLDGIREIGMNDRIANDVREYFESDNRFPKRYKVRPKIYFIMIKTDANTMEEFKDYRNRSGNQPEPQQSYSPTQQRNTSFAEHPQTPFARETKRKDKTSSLYDECFGWYEGAFDFKRVVTLPYTGKNEYRDTHFVVRCKAMSGIDCYNRIIDHLSERVDKRSQFPSAKGKNFSFRFLGFCKEK